jgi:hypothetical protein
LKFQFSIRTRSGQSVDNLRILGIDQADAEIRLRQLYRNAEVTKCERVDNVIKLDTSSSIEDILSLISSTEYTVGDESDGLIINHQELPNLSMPSNERRNSVLLENLGSTVSTEKEITKD